MVQGQGHDLVVQGEGRDLVVQGQEAGDTRSRSSKFKVKYQGDSRAQFHKIKVSYRLVQGQVRQGSRSTSRSPTTSYCV